MFSRDSFDEDVKQVRWFDVYEEEDPDVHLEVLVKWFTAIVDQHAPVKNLTELLEAPGLTLNWNYAKHVTNQSVLLSWLVDILYADKCCY